MSRINPRRAKLHRSYTIVELADRLDVHKHTVRGWVKAGLPTVDGTRPALIHGDEFQVWWRARAKAKKRPLQPGQLYCVKCREGKIPALRMVEYVQLSRTSGNLKALCECCGTMMHRRVRRDEISLIMTGLDVKITEARASIDEPTNPSLNTDQPTEH